METKKVNFVNNRIDYSKPSKVRSLLFDNHYISSNRLSNGNSKLYSILIFNLPAVKTCLNCSDCKTTCYARKSERMYIDTRISRDTNLRLFLTNKELLRELVILQLSNNKENTVRIHESGDFFSQEYIEFWCEIIKSFPLKKFYAYTKVRSILNFDYIESLSNFNLIESFIDSKLNYGSIEYCNDLHTKYGTFICPATKGSDIKFRCGLNCNYCVTKNNVCFVIH